MQQLASWLIGDDEWYRSIWTRRWQVRERRGIEVAAGCLLSRDSVLDRLREIACPALVIHTTHSGMDRERAQELAQGLSGATFIEIAEARLAVTMTHAEPVNHAIQQFLRARTKPTRVR
ncbi:alpha/beta fold hydrolase [Nocardia sp. R7R-8]|uniref:alpha/beta fold hydrolase n=1 Tax=Nocardia sp. R7R-8 TaxID=3459304 RepID=UPI00403D6C2A